MFSHSFLAPRKYYSNPYCPLGSVLMPESVLRNVRAVFEMTVERTTYAIAVTVKLGGWLKNLIRPVFQPMKTRTQTFTAIAWTSDWFFVLFAPVVVGWSDYFGIFLSVEFSTNLGQVGR